MIILTILIPLFFAIYYSMLARKSEYITFDLKLGEKCYSCKEIIELDIHQKLLILSQNKSNYQLCKKCYRHQKLDTLTKYSLFSKINKLKLYLLKDTFNTFFKYLIFLIVSFLIIDIFLKTVYNIEWFNYFYNLLLVLFWSFIIFRHKISSIKKTSD